VVLPELHRILPPALDGATATTHEDRAIGEGVEGADVLRVPSGIGVGPEGGERAVGVEAGEGAAPTAYEDCAVGEGVEGEDVLRVPFGIGVGPEDLEAFVGWGFGFSVEEGFAEGAVVERAREITAARGAAA
jgi:hypothetical protein